MMKGNWYDNNNNNQITCICGVCIIQPVFNIYGNATDRLVVKKMSRYSPEEIAIKELEDTLTDTAYINAILQDALELIASNTEENAQRIAQETLEAISVNNNKE